MALTAAQKTKMLDRIRTIAMALPQATEELTWGDHVNFRVRNKIFCFPGEGDTLTVKCEPAEHEALLDDPRCSLPAYLTRGGWIRMDLTIGKIDWEEIRELVTTSYCLVAPKTLAKQVLA